MKRNLLFVLIASALGQASAATPPIDCGADAQRFQFDISQWTNGQLSLAQTADADLGGEVTIEFLNVTSNTNPTSYPQYRTSGPAAGGPWLTIDHDAQPLDTLLHKAQVKVDREVKISAFDVGDIDNGSSFGDKIIASSGATITNLSTSPLSTISGLEVIGDSGSVSSCGFSSERCNVGVSWGYATADTPRSIEYFALKDPGNDTQWIGWGNIQVCLSKFTLSGQVFIDNDGVTGGVNGTGSNVGGLFANVYDTKTGKVVASVPVNADGTYSTAVFSGDYEVIISTAQSAPGTATKPSVVLPEGYKVSSESATGETLNDGSTNGGVIPVAVGTGKNSTDLKTGLAEPGAISGTVKDDNNQPISGIVLELQNPDGTPVVDAANNPVRVTTGTDGSYTFDKVVSGEYQVVEINEADLGYESVSDSQSSDGDTTANSDTNDNKIPVTVAPGENDENNNFVDKQIQGSIKGQVLLDTNGTTGGVDGTGIEASPDLKAVLVDNNTGKVVAVSDVAGDGQYAFTGAFKGNYTVILTDKPVNVGDAKPAVSIPAGYKVVSESGGEEALNDGSANGGEIAVNVPKLGDSVTDLKTGLSGTGVISGIVKDTDGNTLAGATIALLDKDGNAIKDTNGDPVTVTTGADGKYEFTGLPLGDYQVSESNPSGYLSDSDKDTPSTGNSEKDLIKGITLTSGAPSSTDNDFVDYKVGSISGNIKSDEDDSGAVSAGDKDLSGVTVTLKDSSGTVVATTTTDSGGNYTFKDLKPGQYTVEETNPANYSSVSDTDGTNDDKTTVTLGSGEDKAGVDFLDKPNPGVVSGTVFEDALDGTKKIAGVTIKLTDSKGGVHTTTTGPDGSYKFDNIPSGSFTIVEVDNADYDSVTDRDGTNDNTITGTLPVGGASTGNDFADKLKPATISGKVTSDDDNDDEGDSPIEGVTIELIDKNTGQVVATTTTDANGDYSFKDVTPGNYQVKETDKATYDSVKDTDAGDANVTEVTLAPNESKSGVDFVDERKPGSISGKVERDNDEDLSGDEPIEGVTIELVDSSGNVIATTTTKTDGTYVFADVPAGDYTVREKDPANHKSVKDTDGGNLNETAVTVNPAEATTGIDFVDEYLPGAISGNVSSDNDGDESGDENLSNVTVELIDASGKVIASTTTDSNGNYEFTNVKPGEYTVKETNPNGYDSVSDTDGEDKDVTKVSLAPNESKTNVDFVDKPQPSTITGTVTEDVDGDKTGDNPLPGVTVELIDANTGQPVKDSNGNPITAVTDKDGKYVLEDIPTPGDYIVRETDPSTHDSDHDTDGDNPNETSVSLEAGENKPNVDFVDKPKPGTISGTVTEDVDKDSSGDNPIAGVKVILKDSAGNIVKETTTDENGHYVFEGIPAGDYTVTEEDPTAHTSVSDTDGGDNNVTENVTLPANGSVSGIDFVDEPKPGTISGNVTEDVDSDKSGDKPIAGVKVVLKDAAGNVVKETTTDANGHYEFTGVTPGDYIVTEENSTGYSSVKDTDGGDSDITKVTLPTGGAVANVDFVDEQPKADIGTVTGSVKDDSGNPIAGVKIDLVDDKGNVVKTVTTDKDGKYTFDGVPVGDYTIKETNPTGYTSVSDSADSTGDKPNANTNDDAIPVTVTAGETDAGNDFVDKPSSTPTGSAVADVEEGQSGQPVEVDVTANDPNADPKTVQIIDPNTGKPLPQDTPLVVPGEGTWTLDPTTGKVTFTPETNFKGNPTPITYTVKDKNGTPSTATVTVLYPNPAGEAQNDTKTGETGKPIVVPVLDNDGKGKKPETVKLIDPATGKPTNQPVKVPGEGEWTVDPKTGEVTFTPEPGYTGTNPTPVDYQVEDKNGVVSDATVTVSYPKVPSTNAVNDTKEGDLGQPVKVDTLSNDGGNKIPSSVQIVDKDGNPVGKTLNVPGEGTWTVDSSTGAITFTPEPGFKGNPTPIQYTVKDQNGLTSSATVTVIYPAKSSISSEPKKVPATGGLALLLSGLFMSLFARRRLRKRK